MRAEQNIKSENILARQILLSGIVQGVGFRPFVYRLAQETGIAGWVENRVGQVCIHAEADSASLLLFEQRLLECCPEHARPVLVKTEHIPCQQLSGFEIVESSTEACPDIHICADLPVCNHCLDEMSSPGDRRYRYPFINCTDCGPRYSIIESLPYDRANTTMSGFELCPACNQEYSTAEDRRFHAEPVACPACGPSLAYTSGNTESPNTGMALELAVNAIREGRIIAIKGIGGYHLVCDASNEKTIERLRKLKPRPDKPLAVMMTASQVTDYTQASPEELEFLSGSIHPVLLIDSIPGSPLSRLVSPGLDNIGIMLPYTPLHHLLIQEFGSPLITTSANISGEPVLTTYKDVQQRLSHVAEGILDNNRPITRPADDAVYRFIKNKPRLLRPGRGNAPVELELPISLDQPVLAVGGHTKNTIALAWGQRVVISPHIGDLHNLRSQQVFEQVVSDIQHLYRTEAGHIICDSHPGYSSHSWARKQQLEYSLIPHHHAHASCLAGEYPHQHKWLVFTWDGAGMGTDQTLWGGEALLGNSGDWHRVASLRRYSLPGGEKAARQPWRSAAALCLEAGHDLPKQSKEHRLLHEAWSNKINCPETSSAGRLFDAAASLIGLVHDCSHEGQAPMQLEAAAMQGHANAVELPLARDENGIWRSDWSALLPMLADTSRSIPDRARCFHESLANTILQQSRKMRELFGDFAIGLGGGVFQNRLLAERAMELLQEEGFDCYLPEAIPANDAGLCYGQIIEYSTLKARGLL